MGDASDCNFCSETGITQSDLPGTADYVEALQVGEYMLYGSQRLGIQGDDTTLLNAAYHKFFNHDANGYRLWTVPSGLLNPPAYTASGLHPFYRGFKHYELSNHLGNVLVTVADFKKVALLDDEPSQPYFLPYILSSTDYYPYGMEMPGRGSLGYRYGFNGKERDHEGMGGGGSTYDYGFRIYNPQIARFLSVDPLTTSYPWYTPYQYAGNKPIRYIDLDGLEEADPQRFAAAMQLVLDLESDEVIAANNASCAIRYLKKYEIVNYLKARLSEPALKSHYNSCGPTCAAHIALTHDPEAFVSTVIELWAEGKSANLTVPDNLRDKHYYNNDQIDQLLVGTLRYSENTFGEYILKKPKKVSNWDLYWSNATVPAEMDDFFRRMNASVNLSLVFRSFETNDGIFDDGIEGIAPSEFNKMKEWTESGKKLIFFGYYRGMRHEWSKLKETPGGGDHFVTVNSITFSDDYSNITVSFWHHGEYDGNGYRTKTYTAKEFLKAYKSYSFVKNTGN